MLVRAATLKVFLAAGYTVVGDPPQSTTGTGWLDPSAKGHLALTKFDGELNALVKSGASQQAVDKRPHWYSIFERITFSRKLVILRRASLEAGIKDLPLMAIGKGE